MHPITHRYRTARIASPGEACRPRRSALRQGRRRLARHRLQLAAAGGAAAMISATLVGLPTGETPALADQSTSSAAAPLTGSDLSRLVADRSARQAQGASRSTVRIPAAGTPPLAPSPAPADTAVAPTAAAPAAAAPATPRALARTLATERGWDSAEFTCLSKLWQKESRWDPAAENPGSGAYGIPQALPADRMSTAGSDWRTNPGTQIRWGLRYIDARYGNPCAAWRHSQRLNWY